MMSYDATAITTDQDTTYSGEECSFDELDSLALQRAQNSRSGRSKFRSRYS